MFEVIFNFIQIGDDFIDRWTRTYTCGCVVTNKVGTAFIMRKVNTL